MGASLNTKAKVLYVSTQQIADLIEKEMPFACVIPVPGIKKVPNISIENEKTIVTKANALDAPSEWI